ncbi:MAG: aldolase [Firmicutes bacterium]|nr:aldolase [Bacillota bacterium]
MEQNNFNMRRSRVLQKLRTGKIASCFKVNIADSRVVEIASMMGFDCIWTDMEHVPNDWGIIEKQILAAKAWDVDLMVRVSRGSYSDHVKPLEMDATGIMVPHIMSYEDAKKVVMMTRFHPIGRRPIDGGCSDGAYCNLDLVEYAKQANDQRFVMVQIEDPEPLDELDEIASLEGIDVLFFGPGDFSHGIGKLGQWDHPEIKRARKKIAETALAHGKFAGTVGGIGNLEELIDIGYTFINVGADVVGLSQYCRDIANAFARITSTSIITKKDNSIY